MYKKIDDKIFAIKGWHRLKERNISKRIGVCVICGPVDIKRKPGTQSWRCGNKQRLRNHRIRGSYRIFKKSLCERCGFKPEHWCQLDVHHIDENHSNNDPNNLMTLCANCHRLYEIPYTPRIREKIGEIDDRIEEEINSAN